MKAYRYNSQKREDRRFNNCGKEKNPNAVNFYATNIKYADKYKFIYDEDGDINYECDLQTVEIENKNLFNMNDDFKNLETYSIYISNEIGRQLTDYTNFMNQAKKAKDKKMWANNIEELKNRESELVSMLVCMEFQPLSDFSLQTTLVNELKSKGFEGYITKNEIAIF